jgi:hypothetical protein
MKAALLRPARLTGVLLLVGTFGCADNDLSMSIQQMQAVQLPTCVAMAAVSATTPGLSRGVLDLSVVTTEGYIGVPVVRNNLMPLSSGAGSVEHNSIQITGVDVNLQLPASAAADIAVADRAFFYAAAGGRIDPAGAAAMFVEVLPARLAKQLAPSVPKGGLLTIIAEIRPVGIRGGDQLVGGPIFYPIDICNNCLFTVVNTGTCPFPLGPVIPQGGCFPQQDTATECCTEKTGVILCGANAVAKM